MASQKSGDSYVLSRSTREGVRLTYQRFLLECEVGFRLHPDVPRVGEGLRVADIGCASGLWLTLVSREFPPTAQFDGYDISAAHFPAKELLPKNLTLHVHDAFAPVPPEMQGKFDIVHVGTLFSIVKGNPKPLLENFIAMLKPGGYLQWQEFDYASFQIRSVNPSVSPESLSKLMDVASQYQWGSAEARIRTEKWISEMDVLFSSYGLDVIQFLRFPPSLEISKLWTDNDIMAMTDMFELILSAQDHIGSYSAKEARELLAKAESEGSRGVISQRDAVIAVGRKPVK